MEAIADIREYLVKELLNHDGLALPDDVPLIEEGYLTSLQAVELVLFLEERFRIEIDPEEVTEDNFRTLVSIAALVEKKLRRG